MIILAVIVNKLESEQDITDYKAWMSKKNKRVLTSILRMIETDEKYRPGRWHNVDRRMTLLKEEIEGRD